MAANGREHGLGVGLEQVGDDIVWMLRRDGVRGKATGGKVAQVAGHDHIRSALDRRSQHMAVVGVGQVKPGVVAFAASLRECEHLLRSTLED